MVTSSIVANVLLYMYKKELQHQIAYQTQTVTHTVGDCCLSPEIKICTIQVVIACRVKEALGISNLDTIWIFKSCATESTRNEEMVLLYSVYHATNVALHSIQLYELAKLEGVLSSETVGRIRRRVGIVEKCKMRLQSN